MILLDARDLNARHHLLCDDSDVLSIDVRGLSPSTLTLALPAIEALLAHFPSAAVRVDGEHPAVCALLEAQLRALGRSASSAEADLRVYFHHRREVLRAREGGTRVVGIPRRRDERVGIAEGFLEGVRALGVRVVDAAPRFRFAAAPTATALVDLPREPNRAGAIGAWLEMRGFAVTTTVQPMTRRCAAVERVVALSAFSRIVTRTPALAALASGTRARVLSIHLRDDPRTAPPSAVAFDFRAFAARTLDEIPERAIRSVMESEL